MQTPPLPKALTILIIEDDPLVRDFIANTLAFGTNRTVVAFESGFHGWQYFQNQPQCVDIVIADANLPDLNGIELLEKVKPRCPGILFIVTSSNPANAKAVYQLGGDAFLVKPFEVKDLLTVIRDLVFRVETHPPQTARPSNPFGSTPAGNPTRR